VLPGTPSGLLERVALFTGFGWIGLAGGRAVADPAARRGAASGRTAAPSGGPGPP
jgi:hypothetical protein